MRRVPLLDTLDQEQLERLAEASHYERFGAGSTIVATWESSRDLYAIIEGHAGRTSAASTALMAAGEFFGELAAIDWGAGYGYARQASVIAEDDVHLLVIPSLVVNECMRQVPAFDDLIRSAVRERIHRR